MDMLKMLWIFLVLFVDLIRAQSTAFGICPPVTPVLDFYLDDILGEWYEVEKYSAVFESCPKLSLDLATNNTVKYVKSQKDLIINHRSKNEATLTFYGKQNEGKFKIFFKNDPFSKKYNYVILGTDYNNYLVDFWCKDLFVFHISYVSVYTRDQYPSDDVLENAHQVLEKNNLKVDALIKTDQINC